jgi:hypothetical protein
VVMERGRGKSEQWFVEYFLEMLCLPQTEQRELVFAAMVVVMALCLLDGIRKGVPSIAKGDIKTKSNAGTELLKGNLNKFFPARCGQLDMFSLARCCRYHTCLVGSKGESLQ